MYVFCYDECSRAASNCFQVCSVLRQYVKGPEGVLSSSSCSASVHKPRIAARVPGGPHWNPFTGDEECVSLREDARAPPDLGYSLVHRSSPCHAYVTHHCAPMSLRVVASTVSQTGRTQPCEVPRKTAVGDDSSMAKCLPRKRSVGCSGSKRSQVGGGRCTGGNEAGSFSMVSLICKSSPVASSCRSRDG